MTDPHGPIDSRIILPDCTTHHGSRCRECVIAHLPALLDVADALERVLNIGDALWEDHPPVWMSEADNARAALARLRENQP